MKDPNESAPDYYDPESVRCDGCYRDVEETKCCHGCGRDLCPKCGAFNEEYCEDCYIQLNKEDPIVWPLKEGQ